MSRVAYLAKLQRWVDQKTTQTQPLLAPLHVSGNRQCTAQNKELSWKKWRICWWWESLQNVIFTTKSWKKHYGFLHAKSFGFNYHAIELKKQRFLYPKGPDAPTATLADIHSSLHQFTLPVKVKAFGWLIVHPGRPKFRCLSSRMSWRNGQSCVNTTGNVS